MYTTTTNRARRKHKRYKLSKEFKITLYAIAFMIIFVTYAFWPRTINLHIVEDTYEEEEIMIDDIDLTELRYNQICKEAEEAEKPIENKYIYDITNEERELLLKLVYREANTESVECQMAVLQVVFNRTVSDSFGGSIHDVVYAKGQFEPVLCSNFETTTYNETNVKALERVLKGEKIIPDDVLYFWSMNINVNNPGTWFNYMHRNYFCKQINRTRFYY